MYVFVYTYVCINVYANKCVCVYIYIYIYIYIKLVTIVKGHLKAPFSIAMTLRFREGHYFLLWIAPLYP